MDSGLKVLWEKLVEEGRDVGDLSCGVVRAFVCMIEEQRDRPER